MAILPVDMQTPELDEVVAAMREGVSFQIGGGRCFETFEMKDGQLVVVRSDDGFTEDVKITLDWLREAIGRDPEVFRQYLEYWRARAR